MLFMLKIVINNNINDTNTLSCQQITITPFTTMTLKSKILSLF